MAKQIKVVKCPHCGNAKPLSIGKDHYRCDKCSTEFFLDNDDVNINVNHSYNSNVSKNSNQNKGVIAVIIGVVFFVFFIFVLQLCTSIVKDATKNRTAYTAPAPQVKKKRVDVQLLQTGNKPIVFYLESRNAYQREVEKDGLFAVFYDFINDEIISETRVSENNYSQIEHQFFYSNGRHYYTVDYRNLWELNVDKCEINNVTNAIAQAKPALNSGFSTIRFVDKKNGDGLILTTNLGKSFYYFPTVDQLYTHSAFNHMTSPRGLGMVKDEDTTLRLYYLFLNKDSKESSNVAQLMQITYKYNNGGPEYMLTKLTDWTIKHREPYRIVSIKPITEDRISFFPEVLYSDSAEVLVSYRPTLAENAPHDIELLTIKGTTIWKVEYNDKLECESITKTDSTYYIQANKSLILEVKRNGVKKEYSLS